MITPTVLTVTQLNTYIKSVVDGDPNLKNVFVQGEISNFTNHYRTGHWYMSIKDSECSIKAVMFRSSNMRLRFSPENGMGVLVRGRISVFERDGQYQLYIDDMQPEGAGELAVAFEQLKARLAAKGLFEEDRKKPIPRYPQKIGVVTSDTGAAVHDIINVITRRYPLAQVIIAPVQVQGIFAAGQISEAIRNFNRQMAADVLIVGRGGGSAEDLWAFNEEIVAMAIAESDIPVISAVGHETDFTISDFVADLRAPTPSAAAELATPDIQEIKYYVEALYNQCYDTVSTFIYNEKDRLAFINKRLEYLNPETVIENKMQTVDILSTQMLNSIKNIFSKKSAELSSLAAKLDAMSPIKVMARGYAIVYNDNTAISSVKQINSGDKLKLVMADGEATVTAD